MGLPEPRVLGDSGLRRRDGDRSDRRLARPPQRHELGARDLGRAKTWAQALAAAIAGLAAAGLWSDDVAWWALLVALVATWVSGLDYARVAPRVLRGEGV